MKTKIILRIDDGTPFNFVRILSRTKLIKGILSDEHSASNYGLPVVLIDGQPFGPAELPTGAQLEIDTLKGDVSRSITDAERQLMVSARNAGYNCPGY